MKAVECPAWDAMPRRLCSSIQCDRIRREDAGGIRRWETHPTRQLTTAVALSTDDFCIRKCSAVRPG
jgi:hypothetical protein